MSIQLGKVSEGALTFVQEPYTCKGNVAKIGKGCQVLAKVGCQARAAIITKNMNIGFCESLSSRDIAVAKGTFAKMRTYIISAYLDYTMDMSSLGRVLEQISKTNEQILICCDANAWSLWWSDREGPRGKMFEELMMAYGLDLLNVGRTPTFVSSRYSSIIDVTCATKKLALAIQGWHVNTEHQFSDHRRIEFRTWNFKACHWPTFQEKMEEAYERDTFHTKNSFNCRDVDIYGAAVKFRHRGSSTGQLQKSAHKNWQMEA